MTTLLDNTRRPDVTFHANGRIDITARVSKMLMLQEGDVIDIAIEGGEYLMFRKHKAENLVGRHEAQCHTTKRGKHHSNNMRVYSKKLCDAMLQAANATSSAGMPAGATKELSNYGTAVIIITRSVL